MIRVTLGIASALVLVTSGANAQRSPLPSPTSSTLTFNLVRSIGTADEKPIIDGVTSRLKARYADPAWAKRFSDALSLRRTEDARRLVVGAAQVPGSAAEFLYRGEALPADDTDAPLSLQPAAWRPGDFRPWYLLVHTPWAFVMICSTVGECKRGWKESKEAGLTW